MGERMDRVAVVVGGASGIGAAIARAIGGRRVHGSSWPICRGADVDAT